MVMTFYSDHKDGLSIRGVPLATAHPGSVFYVGNSTVTRPNGVIGVDDPAYGSYDRPFATLDYAIGRCTASRGDIIYVLPGHSESVTSTSLTMDVAGIAVIGLGHGNLRPLFNFGVTSSTITWSAANCYLGNVRLKATVDSVVAGITLSGANNVMDIETEDTSSAVEFISAVVTSATADNLWIKARHKGFAAGDAMTRYIDLVGCQGARIEVDFFGKASTSIVDMRTTACDNIEVLGTFYNESAALTKNVTNNTTSTWSVRGYDAKAGQEFAGSDDTAVAYVSGNFSALPQSVTSGAKTLTTGDVTMFTIAGGPIKVLELVGIVTTVVQAQATSTKVTVTTTSPAATVDFSAAAVDLTGAAAGASIRHINTTGILTVVTAGFVMEGNAFATNDTQYLVPAGTMKINNASASNTGAITWYMRYVPLAPGVTVT